MRGLFSQSVIIFFTFLVTLFSSSISFSKLPEISSRVISRLSVKYERKDYNGVFEMTSKYIQEIKDQKMSVAYDPVNYMLLAEFHLLACN